VLPDSHKNLVAESQVVVKQGLSDIVDLLKTLKTSLVAPFEHSLTVYFWKAVDSRNNAGSTVENTGVELQDYGV
jgi:hypothetical protein